MDSDQEYICESDSGNESSENDGIGLEFDSDEGVGGGAVSVGRGKDLDDYPFEVLTMEDITKHMIECIKEVNNVVNVSITMWSYTRNNNKFLPNIYLYFFA